MLRNLHIENIAVIESVDVDFSPGFNVLTGETGAGKSILIDSINAVLGQRTSRELIRTGASSAYVSALFEDPGEEAVELLKNLGYGCDDGNILIQRRMTPDGKNNCRVNGYPAATASLKELGQALINIHGQHDSQALLNPDEHYKFIDLMGDLKNDLDKFKSSYFELKSLYSHIESLIKNRAEKAQRADYLRFCINELESAGITAGEWDALTNRKNLLLNSEKIASALNSCLSALEGDEDGYSQGAVQSIEGAVSQLSGVEMYSDRLKDLSSRLSSLSLELSDISSELRPLALDLEFDPKELEEVEERLDKLYRLSKKYGSDEGEMLRYLESAKSELEGAEITDDEIVRLKEKFAQLKAKTHELADLLSDKRKACATRFSEKVSKELSELDMPNVRFEVDFKRRSVDENGVDNIEFLISANPGELPKPLAKIASGGELSRIMLAIKNVLSGFDDVGTLIFDEIDTGTSGRAAQKIGRKLRSASASRQVICVTHLAQIACCADTHMLIEKKSDNQSTKTTVNTLDFDGRCHELARIIGGDIITESTLAASRELLGGENK
ncbi:MAG: DNA repair protein RecN [Clostridia bacterium]|nr:DNA repair protein RecN [Clostridia bacterium]